MPSISVLGTSVASQFLRAIRFFIGRIITPGLNDSALDSGFGPWNTRRCAHEHTAYCSQDSLL